MIRELYVIFFILFRSAFSELRVDPLVHTKVGLIRGLKASDGDYSMFMGIPYATVDPANPFGAALPKTDLGDNFKAFDDSARCPQIQNGVVDGDLDCLHLNIYVPNTASSANKLPVMVWIYGGDFQRGDGGRKLYGPKFLVRHDVILVTINYRIGAYGFMCLDTPDVPGNQGLKDQILALRWIKDNIESFSGDVNAITIFGQSAGSRAIDFHLLSEQEKLFSKAILQSGTAFNRNTIVDSDITAPLKISEHLGLKTNDLQQALNFLASTDSILVVSAADHIGLDFRPCVEKQFDGIERAISDYSVNLNYTWNKQVPMMIGYANSEQVARYADKKPEYFQGLDVFRERLTDYFDFTEEEVTDMEKIVRHFYIGDKEINEDVMWEIIDFDSDFTYSSATERTIKKYLEHINEEVYYYVFSYVGNRNFYKDSRNVTVGGTAHADDLGYLFDIKSYTDQPSEKDQLTIDRLTKLWANFAKYSTPTPEIDDVIPVAWKPVEKGTLNYIEIGSDFEAKKRPIHSRMAFWELFFHINWKKQKGFKSH